MDSYFNKIQRPIGWKNTGCCTTGNPCKKNEGGCSDDSHCLGGLKCGHGNCPTTLALEGIDRCCELRKFN